MGFSRQLLCISLLVLPPLAGTHLEGQTPDTLPRPSAELVRLVTVGSPQEERDRLAQLLGEKVTDGFLLRSPSTRTPTLASPLTTMRLQVLAPELAGSWNSEIPFSLNEGALWAGRGINTRLMAGVRASYGPLSLTLAPQFVYSENQPFETLPSTLYERVAGRSSFTSFWFLRPASIDLPYRFGEEAYATIDPGQSSLAVHVGRVGVGFATENQWWGPGIRNAIVMSNNAPGIPHFFLQTTSPVPSPVGAFEAKWMVGGLTESLFFDTQRNNDLRSLSAFAVTFTPAGEPDLTLGAARVTYANAGSTARLLKSAFDVFTNWEQIGDHGPEQAWLRPDQFLSLFGRWIFPESGLEVYGEWARHQLPASLRDFLIAPHHSQGYTLGLQWARPFTPGVLRLQGEVTSLEQSATFRQRPITTFYTSRRIPQGYTHRGQVIGAAIGPGSSSIWTAADFLAPRWQAGVFLGWIRWETDALYLSHSPLWWRGTERSFHAYDASLLGGVRMGYRFPQLEIGLEMTTANRYNFLFQNPDLGWGPEGAVDVRNHTLRFFLLPLRL